MKHTGGRCEPSKYANERMLGWRRRRNNWPGAPQAAAPDAPGSLDADRKAEQLDQLIAEIHGIVHKYPGLAAELTGAVELFGEKVR